MAAAGDGLEKNMGAAPSAPHGFAKAEVSESGGKDVIEAAEKDPETPGESTED
jgi:molecular chaperone DnaK/molecular chaperone HscA